MNQLSPKRTLREKLKSTTDTKWLVGTSIYINHTRLQCYEPSQMIEIINNLNYVEYLSTLNPCLIRRSNTNKMIRNAHLKAHCRGCGWLVVINNNQKLVAIKNNALGLK